MRFGLRKIFSLFFFGMFTVVLFSSLSVNAAGTDSGYELLAPIPTVVDDAGNPITTNITLVDYMKGLFVAAIGLAIVLAVVQLVIGGIEYVAAAVPSAKEDAKRRIGGAVGGLLLILLSWVLLQALNPKLLSVGLNLEKIAVVGQPPGGPPPPPPTWCMFNNQSNLKLTGEFDTEVLCNDAKGSLDVTCRLCTWTPGGGGNCPATSAEYVAGDNAIRAQLEAGGVQVKSNKCTFCGQDGCTSVYGLPQNAISALISLKASCGCEVFVTGGTEAGHVTHGIGKSIVDLRHTSSLDAYLKNVACTKSGRPVYGNSGNYFWDEDPLHFHVTFGASQC